MEGDVQSNKYTHTHTHTQRTRGDVGNGRDLCRQQRRQERISPVAANPDNLENRKEAGGGKHRVPRAQVRTVQVERVCPLCRF